MAGGRSGRHGRHSPSSAPIRSRPKAIQNRSPETPASAAICVRPSRGAVRAQGSVSVAQAECRDPGDDRRGDIRGEGPATSDCCSTRGMRLFDLTAIGGRRGGAELALVAMSHPSEGTSSELTSTGPDCSAAAITALHRADRQHPKVPGGAGVWCGSDGSGRARVVPAPWHLLSRFSNVWHRCRSNDSGGLPDDRHRHQPRYGRPTARTRTPGKRR